MPKDIRSYFMTTSKRPLKQVTESPAVKRKARQISSEEDEISENPKGNTLGKAKKTDKKRRVIQSDSESSTTKNDKKPNLSKLQHSDSVQKKSINVTDLFGTEPKRIERKKPKIENTVNESVSIPSDDEFSITELNLDVESQLKKDNLKAEVSKAKTPEKQSLNAFSKRAGSESPKKSVKSPSRHRGTKVEESHVHNKSNIEGAPNKLTTVDPNKSTLFDEDRQEKRNLASILFQKYKNRQSVINPGSKEVPKGEPNCLAGLSFLVTGILESLEREEAHKVIEDHGGKISKTVGKRLTYMVVGEEAGPKKLITAEEFGIPMITEDQLFDLIRTRSIKNASTENVKENSSKSKNKKDINKEKIPEKGKMLETGNNLKSPNGRKKMKLEIPLNEKMNKELQQSTTNEKEQANTQAWVDKYKPQSIKEIVGQQGAASCCAKLRNWLSKWYENRDGKKKLQRPNPFSKTDDGSFFKAALLSGPPGVGKTTTAHLVCKDLGFTFVELNASDTRNKRLLHDEVANLITNTSCYGYYHQDKGSVTKKHALIMDEVDGMAGNEDRGGVQELITIIKSTKIPIICMCNDRNHPKIRSLANYCYDLRVNKPRLEQIKGMMMSICYKENLKLSPSKIAEIITATNCDIRQTLNHLSMISVLKDVNLEGKIAKKDFKLGPWDVVRKVFSSSEHQNMTLNDKSDLYFNDYSLAPLFVQENYLKVTPHVPKDKIMQRIALTADSLSLGDLIDRKIRSNSAWNLLPVQAMFSSVLPGEYMAGHFTGQINFPEWLGKNSTTTQRNRLAQEIHAHTRIRTSGSRLSIRLDYAPFLLDAIVRPLKNLGQEGVEESLKVIKEYHLLKDDIESLIKLTSWPGKKNPMDSIDGKVKAALTRAYNKEVPVYSYSVSVGVKKKKAEVEDNLDTLNEEDETVLPDIDDEEVNKEEDDIENDPTIKKKKPAVKAPTTSKELNPKTVAPSGRGRRGRSKK